MSSDIIVPCGSLKTAGYFCALTASGERTHKSPRPELFRNSHYVWAGKTSGSGGISICQGVQAEEACHITIIIPRTSLIQPGLLVALLLGG